MTVTAEEDFREFVTARWGELEPVASLVTLDPSTARRVTTDALADLHGQWGRLLEEGSPGATARRVVLAGSLAAGPGTRHRPSRVATGTSPAVPAPAETAPDASDDVTAALLPVLRDAAPLERAVLAAARTWGLEPGEVADLLGMPCAPVDDADRSVRRRLLAAHTAARARGGWGPAEWALDRDVDDALDLLLGEHSDPPDAVALVDEHHRRVRRRSVVLGAGGALAAGAVAVLGLDAVATGASSRAAAPLPPKPGDPVWSSTRSWPARGRLASDDEVRAFVAGASPGAQLLYADDIAGQRLVVAATADAGGAAGTLVKLWTGPRGTAAGSLTPATLVRDRVTLMDDVVPIAVEARRDGGDGTGVVLLLARPPVLEASYSSVVAYSRSGDVARRWTDVALHDGIATIGFRGPLPPTFRVRLDGYDGGPLGEGALGLPAADPSAPLASTLVQALDPFVAACTGLPASAVHSRIVLEAPVAGTVLTPVEAGEQAGAGRVVVALTTVPSGAVLRTVRVAGDGRDAVGPVDIETTRLMAPRAATTPLSARLPSFRPDAGRFLVLAPGAARAQLVATSSTTYPASGVTALSDGSGVLEVADARRAGSYRLVTWDRRGRRLGDWETVFRRGDPRDLWPRVR